MDNNLLLFWNEFISKIDDSIWTKIYREKDKDLQIFVIHFKSIVE